MPRELIDLFEQEWRTVSALCRELDDEDWQRPTDCPGWTVKDQVAHLASLEGVFLGRPIPDHEPADTRHVRNDIGRLNEILVDLRRPWPPAQVLAELDEVVAERLARLRAMSDEEWRAETWTPVGPGDQDQLLSTRLYDWWAHEQDIRRAVDRPGNLDGPVAELVVDRLVGALGYVLVKRAGAGEGTRITVELTPPVVRRVGVVVEQGRGRLTDPDGGDALLRLDSEAFCLLGLGRRTAAELADRIAYGGDEQLARRVAEGLNVTI